MRIEVAAAPTGLATAHTVLLTEGARQFLTELVLQFEADVEEVCS
jgi:hypothetical protein